MTDILTRKLANFAPLSSDGRRLLVEFAGLGRRLDTHTDLIREGDRPDREGDRPDDVRLVLEGLAYRYKILTDGRRHIMAYLIPGDLYDMHVFHPQGNGSQHRYALGLPSGRYTTASDSGITGAASTFRRTASNDPAWD